MNKGEIWLVEMPATDGHEQSGKRPVIILADTQANIVIVIPFTSHLQALRFPNTIEVTPSEENGLTAKSIALIFQIRAIDKKRIMNKIGKLESSYLKKADSALKNLMQIN